MSAGSGSLLLIACLDMIMLSFLGLQFIWRQRVIQLIVVACCTLGFTILTAGAALRVAEASYVDGTDGLLVVVLFLSAIGSGAAVVFLILALAHRDRNAPTRLAYATGGYPASPPPVPPVPGRGGPPPVPPGRRAKAIQMPLGVQVAIACVFGASLLLKLFSLTQYDVDVSSGFLVGFAIDVVMLVFGLSLSKWSSPKLASALMLVVVSILTLFFLSSVYFIAMRISYMLRYWPSSFYLLQAFGLLRLGAAIAALVYCIQSAFATSRVSSRSADPLPRVPSS